MLAHPQRLVCRHTTLTARFHGVCSFYLLDVTAMQVGLVFKPCDELSPSGVCLLRAFCESSNIGFTSKSLNEHGVVLGDKAPF